MYKLSQQLQLYSETLQCNTLLHSHSQGFPVLFTQICVYLTVSVQKEALHDH